MPQSKLLPLALLYTDNSREIDGATRFQKLVFLAQEETDLPDIFEYQSDKYGPFSPELAATLDELENMNLIEKKISHNRSGNEKHLYSLTGEGRRIVMKILNEHGDGAFKTLLDESEQIKQKRETGESGGYSEADRRRQDKAKDS